MHYLAAIQLWMATRGNNDRGAVMVEYALMVVLVTLALITIVAAMTVEIGNFFKVATNKFHDIRS